MAFVAVSSALRTVHEPFSPTARDRGIVNLTIISWTNSAYYQFYFWDRTSGTECLGQNVSIAGQYGTGTERWDRTSKTEGSGQNV